MERRQHPRLQTRRKVGVILSSGEVLQLWTYDVSKEGLKLLSPYNADHGDVLKMFIALPRTDGGEHVRVDMLARVAHVTYSGSDSCYRVGFAIQEFLSEEGAFLWEDWVENKLGQQYSMQGTF